MWNSRNTDQFNFAPCLFGVCLPFVAKRVQLSCEHQCWQIRLKDLPILGIVSKNFIIKMVRDDFSLLQTLLAVEPLRNVDESTPSVPQEVMEWTLSPGRIRTDSSVEIPMVKTLWRSHTGTDNSWNRRRILASRQRWLTTAAICPPAERRPMSRLNSLAFWVRTWVVVGWRQYQRVLRQEVYYYWPS